MSANVFYSLGLVGGCALLGLIVEAGAETGWLVVGRMHSVVCAVPNSDSCSSAEWANNLLSSVPAPTAFGCSAGLVAGCRHSCLSASHCFCCIVWAEKLIPQAEQINS